MCYMQASNTPLHNAAAYGHLDTVKLLIQKRASLKRRNRVSHLISAHLQLFHNNTIGTADSTRSCKEEDAC